VQHERPASFSSAVPNGTAAGIAIAVSAIATIFAIAHHPTVTTRAPAEAIAQMVRLATMDRIVHGVVIVLLGALLFGFSVFSLRRGLHRQLVVAALLAYAAGSGVMIGAALIDGFLIPQIAARYAGARPDVITFAAQILSVCAMTIQILAQFGVLALSSAVVLWSADLVQTPGALRVTGIIGVASGAAAVVVLAFAGWLNPHNLIAIVLLQAIWYVAIAVLLIRGRV
jgi:hypothetical protein